MGMSTTTMGEITTNDNISSTNDEIVDLPRAVDLLFANENEKKLYWDRSHYDSPESQMRALARSKTLYVGNLAFSTRSHNLRSHFSQLGPVRIIHMGLDRFRKTPCGFAFVEYYRRKDALLAVAHLSQTKLDGRVIRVELDAGFQPGRQYGRGVSGGQVRDDRRNSYDPARTGQRHRPKWTPPTKATSQEAVPADTSATGHYGPAETDEKESTESIMAQDQEMESNNRYREEGM
eukprot:CAMPEP_0194213404 /NCGR_PEP_ID=MMETSP0156-20130528/13945_1 /TAXON_ID=33649 /ORGANISM="Thalassionema nitzschioides, Strain L26-B" /LENGTH=233 /DNA_ID=CAMNT_0038941413 /DNA_START=57 /DNA_END=758 /DNA_ORIENTATION=+